MAAKSYWIEAVRSRSSGKVVSYKARYRLPDGSKRNRSFPVRGAPPGGAKRQAEDHLAEVRRDRNHGVHVDDHLGRATFAEEADRWLQSVAAGLERSTYQDYEGLVRVWLKPRFGSWSLQDLGYDDIQAFVNELSGWDPREGRYVPERARLGAERIRRCCFVLQSILTEAVLRGRLARSPYLKVRRPRSGTAAGRVPKTMRWLDAVQVEALAGAIDRRYTAMIYVMAWGGLRFGEAAALRRASCGFLGGGQLRVTEARKPGKGEVYGDTKSHQARSVWLPPDVCDSLQRHLDEFVGKHSEALVFTAPGGGPLSHSNFLKLRWIPALERAGLDLRLRPHDLRHTCASLLAAEGWSMVEVKEQLGHSSITVTEKYTHFFPTHLAEKARRSNRTVRAARAAKHRPKVVQLRGGSQAG
jgi:integrase